MAGHAQQRHAHWQVEAAWSGAARIEVEDAVSALYRRPVRVPVDDGVHLCRFGIEIEVIEVVEHVQQRLAHFDDLGPGQPVAHIDVAANGGDGRNRAQRVKHARLAYVARVDDVLDAAQRVYRLRAQQPMSIRDHADEVSGGHGDLRNQLEVFGMCGADYREITAIKGTNSDNIEPFTQRCEAAIHKIQLGGAICFHHGYRAGKV